MDEKIAAALAAALVAPPDVGQTVPQARRIDLILRPILFCVNEEVAASRPGYAQADPAP